MASGVMARSWPSRSRSLHGDPCAGERVIESRIKLSNYPKKNASALVAVFRP